MNIAQILIKLPTSELNMAATALSVESYSSNKGKHMVFKFSDGSKLVFGSSLGVFVMPEA